MMFMVINIIMFPNFTFFLLIIVGPTVDGTGSSDLGGTPVKRKSMVGVGGAVSPTQKHLTSGHSSPTGGQSGNSTLVTVNT